MRTEVHSPGRIGTYLRRAARKTTLHATVQPTPPQARNVSHPARATCKERSRAACERAAQCTACGARGMPKRLRRARPRGRSQPAQRTICCSKMRRGATRLTVLQRGRMRCSVATCGLRPQAFPPRTAADMRPRTTSQHGMLRCNVVHLRCSTFCVATWRVALHELDAWYTVSCGVATCRAASRHAAVPRCAALQRCGRVRTRR